MPTVRILYIGIVGMILLLGNSTRISTLLASVNNVVKYKIFATSDMEEYIVGKEGWLFYNRGNFFKDVTGAAPFSEKELSDWKYYLETSTKAFQNLGIQYYFVVAPNKHTIYPEFLPSSVYYFGPTRLEQLQEYMKDTEVKLIDLRPSLYEAKKSKMTYYKDGTHWNSFGAYAAYKAIATVIQKNVHTVSLLSDKDMYLSKEKKGQPGLLYKMQLASAIPTTQYDQYRMTDPHPNTMTKVGKDFTSGSRISYKTNRPELPNIVVYRDSFFTALQPFFTELSNNATFHWRTHHAAIQKKEVDTRDADIVIEEIVERKLFLLPPPVPEQWMLEIVKKT